MAQSSEKLLSQTMINLRENVSTTSLKSGKEIENPIGDSLEAVQKDQVETEVEAKKKMEHHREVQSKTVLNNFTSCIPLPFPSKRTKSKKDEQQKEIL